MRHLTALRSRAGFTLIEVLVTLVILTIGLLGIAGLMAQGQRSAFEAYQRQQALALANDMAERVKSNRQGVDDTAVGTTYDGAVTLGAAAGDGTRFSALTTGTITNCATGTCTTEEVVAYDAALWDGLLAGGASETSAATGDALGPLLSARGCIENINATACPACGGPPSSRQITYRISVAWQGNYSTVAPADSVCGQGTYQPNDTFRRLVSVDVYTVIPCACP
jgi:type IV pilus assembly protein PilV